MSGSVSSSAAAAAASSALIAPTVMIGSIAVHLSRHPELQQQLRALGALGRLAQRATKEGRQLIGIARDLPYQVHDVLQEVRDGQIEVGFVHKGLDEFMHKLDVVFNRLVVALVVAGGLLGSSMIGILATEGPQIFGIHFLSVIGFVVSGTLGAWLLVGVLRSGRI